MQRHKILSIIYIVAKKILPKCTHISIVNYILRKYYFVNYHMICYNYL